MRRAHTTRREAIWETETAPMSSVHQRRAWHGRLDWWAALLLAPALGLRLWFTLRGWPVLDSDEALIGLMSRHILYNGEHPIFYYGQHYMGTLEAYLVVPFFWLLGPTQVALRLAMLLFIMPFLLCVYLLGRAAYGRAVGLLALGALAFGPAFGLMREAPSIGGYQETLLFGALLPLLAYLRLRAPLAPTQRRATQLVCVAQYLAFGVVAGMGIWSDELILIFIATPLLALLLARPRELFWPPALGGLIVGFLVGAAPFLRYNLLNNGQTFTELSLQESSSHLGLHELFAQIGSTLSIGLPAIFGSPQICVAPGAVYAGYISYPAVAVRSAIPSACQITTAANTLFALVILGLYLFAAAPLVRALRAFQATGLLRDRMRASWGLAPIASVGASGTSGRRDLSEAPTRPIPAHTEALPDARRIARLWLRGMLIAAALGTVAEYALSRRTVGADEFVVVRYLLPLYITLPVVIGALWEGVAPLARRLRSRRSGGKARVARSGIVQNAGAALASGVLVLLLVCFVSSGVAATITSTDASQFAVPATQDQQVISELHTLGITAYYGYYWMCYNLVFASGEQLHCSSYGRVERYQPYATYLSHVQHPAYLLQVGSADDATFQRDQAPGLYRAGYTRVVFDGFAIYYLPTSH